MALFRSFVAAEPGPSLAGDGVVLRVPQMADYEAWAELRAASRAFLKPWEPTWPADDLTRAAFRRRLKRYTLELENDQAYPFFLFREGDGALLGGLNLSNVRRGVAQACSLGYWMGAPHAGKGHMSAGVRAKILAASAYLDVAPTVVEVARSLDIEPPLEGIRALDPSEQDVATALAEKWNLGGSMARAVAAVATIGD